jgi:hypothetical protein
MNYQTFISRNHAKAWDAKTIVPLKDRQQLTIHTYKNHRGALATYASVGTLERGFVTHKLYDDYSKCFAAEAVRCTEKAVAAQHRDVLARLPTILDDITRHYTGDLALIA